VVSSSGVHRQAGEFAFRETIRARGLTHFVACHAAASDTSASPPLFARRNPSNTRAGTLHMMSESMDRGFVFPSRLHGGPHRASPFRPVDLVRKINLVSTEARVVVRPRAPTAKNRAPLFCSAAAVYPGISSPFTCGRDCDAAMSDGVRRRRPSFASRSPIRRAHADEIDARKKCIRAANPASVYLLTVICHPAISTAVRRIPSL